MGFFSRLGSKLSHIYDAGARLGHKVVGGVSRIGHKVSDVGHKVLNTISDSPLGAVPILSSAVNIGQKVLGGVDRLTALADKGLAVGSEVGKVVSAGRSVLEKKPAVAPPTAGIQAHSSTPSSLKTAPKQDTGIGELTGRRQRSMRG
tara:strand:- start:1113 stop:1553 length:441 start_codon:yes stop_codon:yes gene_type:complete